MQCSEPGCNQPAIKKVAGFYHCSHHLNGKEWVCLECHELLDRLVFIDLNKYDRSPCCHAATEEIGSMTEIACVV